MSAAAGFKRVQRPTGPVWKHATKPVWIVYYAAILGVRAGHFQAYRAVAPVPAGREPWSVDNRRIGAEGRGFKTLNEAAKATGGAP